MNGKIVEFQPWDAKHHWVVAKLCDEHRQGLLMFEYYKVGVGNMWDVDQGYRVAIDELKTFCDTGGVYVGVGDAMQHLRLRKRFL